MGSFRESKIVLKDFKENKEYLELREKELNDIKKVSGQILGMTNAMSQDVRAEGQILSK